MCVNWTEHKKIENDANVEDVFALHFHFHVQVQLEGEIYEVVKNLWPVYFMKMKSRPQFFNFSFLFSLLMVRT